MGKSKAVTIERVEKKLRQAEFFLRHLDRDPYELALQLRNARGEANAESSEFYFSAFLSAAKSTKDLLHRIQDPLVQQRLQAETDRFNDELEKARLIETPDGMQFLEVLDLRNDDLHRAGTGAEAVGKQIPYDPLRESGELQFFYNATIYNQGPPSRHINPDGSAVTTAAMIGTIGLFLDYKGRRIEAITICRDLIKQLKDLVDRTKAAQRPTPTAAS